ncbi:hypothetical protein P171DRAFT_489556 [Karstenula rhodostoma CBS 690.94]|uniref:Uncharacterized protein n=1 Tax=Karstenula rhodostoma CBS 690.94 TaxID=1392251 RepID=A0A9P4PB24_9PLEO|nr:hypothetical protein P171DRAFT_489556 [Karstenula rhodostoma CBS 690.94]
MPLIVSLPQLKKLRLKHFDIAGVNRKRKDRDSAQWRVEEGALGIEELWIKNCPMTNEILQRIIRSCRRLTKFHFKIWEDDKYEGRRRFWRQELDVDSLHAALSRHKDSLEELSLNCINVWERMDDYSPAQTLPAYPSFQDLPRLKIFKIEYRRMRYANLPPNIAHLYLYDCRDVKDAAEVEAWKAIKRTYCPELDNFQIMCTDNCRAVQYQLKYMHFHSGCWTVQTRDWDKDGFELRVWFKDFIDGTYNFSQGTDDTGDIDSNGEKIRYDDYGEKVRYDDEDEDEDDDEDGDEDDDDEDADTANDERSNGNEDEMNLGDDQPRPQSPLSLSLSLSPAHSHTSDWVADQISNPAGSDIELADQLSNPSEPDIELEYARSIQSTGTFEWVDELISEAEDEEKEDEDEYPPKTEDARGVLLAEEEEEDDGWTGGEWRAPREVYVVEEKTGKKRGEL